MLAARKASDEAYTVARFAKALGFSSHSGLAMVLSGQRELGNTYIDRCVKELGLSIQQQLYFEAMVRAGTLSIGKKRALLRELEFHATKWEPPARHQGVRLLDFFLVQQILSLYRGAVDTQTIMDHFRYEVKRSEVLAVLQWMLERGYVEKSPHGWRIQKSVLLVKDEVPNASARQFHKDCWDMARSALDSDPLENREFQTYLFTVNSARIGEMKTWLKKVVLDGIAKFEDELDGDTVMQLHFNLFEMANRMRSRGCRKHR